MKKLSQFLTFDIDGFLAGKILAVTGIKPWPDYDHKGKTLGTIVEVVFLEDNTHYQLKGDETVSNRYEKINVKVPQHSVSVSIGDTVELIHPVATVYGERRDQLSVRADGIEAIN